MSNLKEAVLWSFSIRLDDNGNLVLVKRAISNKDLAKLNFGDLPLAELIEITDVLNGYSNIIEAELNSIVSRKGK